MAEKPTWGTFITKLIIKIITLVSVWALGSNFIYLAGRSKSNPYNNYSDAYNPGWFDWPYHKEYMPYSNRDPLNNNLADADPAKKKFEELHAEFHKNQKGGGSSWKSFLEKKFSKMTTSKSRKRSYGRRKNKSRKMHQRGGNPEMTTPTESNSSDANTTTKGDNEPASNIDSLTGSDGDKQFEVFKKIYHDFEIYYGKGGYGGATSYGDEEDEKGRKVDKLGPIGKVYLNLDITSNKYGPPYSWQCDGRETVTMSGDTIKNPHYNDGSLFGDENVNMVGSLKEMSGMKKSFQQSKVASTIPIVKSEPSVPPLPDTKSAPPTADTKSAPPTADTKSAPPTAPPMKGGNPQGKRKKLPPTLIEQLTYFISGGWVKLFTQGAPDIFSWVQENSWSTHRWIMHKFLKYIGSMYPNNPSGLMWVLIGIIIHISPPLLSFFFLSIYPWISIILTSLQYYAYGLLKENSILTGWLWSGNFLFIPQIMVGLTFWIPIVNIIVGFLAGCFSIFPSLQNIIVSTITGLLQTIRSFIYLSIGHLVTPDGSQFWKGNMFGDYKYRGLFIFEACLLTSWTVADYLPYNEFIRKGAAMGVMGAWGLFQFIAWMRGNSGWKGWNGDPNLDIPDSSRKVSKTS